MATNTQPIVSFSEIGDSLITEPKLRYNFRFRLVDAYEGITTVNTLTNYLISPNYKFFYTKKLTDKEVRTTKVQLLGLNTLWVNKDSDVTVLI